MIFRLRSSASHRSAGSSGGRSDRKAPLPCKSPKSLGGANTQSLCLYVDDVDAHYQQARASGAIIADEPTSALDADARDRFIALLSEEVTRSGASLLFVSHDASLAPLFTRAVDLAAINRAGVSA